MGPSSTIVPRKEFVSTMKSSCEMRSHALFSNVHHFMQQEDTGRRTSGERSRMFRFACSLKPVRVALLRSSLVSISPHSPRGSFETKLIGAKLK